MNSLNLSDSLNSFLQSSSKIQVKYISSEKEKIEKRGKKECYLGVLSIGA
jgi:hypothetical protein